MILISACLVGLNCKYNGENNFNKEIFDMVKNGEAIFVCPEQLGGLNTPRVPSEIKYIDGIRHVITKDGRDVTKEYEIGALETLKMTKKLGITKAILKANSPSCGCGKIYDGTFTGTKIIGNGITTQILLDNGIDVITEEELKKM